MYEIRYYQDWSSRYIVLATCDSLAEEARARARCPGIWWSSGHNMVVADPYWLWDWEKDDPRRVRASEPRTTPPRHDRRPYVDLFGRYGVLSL